MNNYLCTIIKTMDWYHRKTVNIISMTNCSTFGYCANYTKCVTQNV